jgi:hypothetical protein
VKSSSVAAGAGSHVAPAALFGRWRAAPQLRRYAPIRIACLWLLLFGSAVGQQAPTLLPQCGMPTDVVKDWKPLAKPPQHGDALLDLSSSNGSVRSQLGQKPAGATETWFRSKTGKLRYCRYIPAADVCTASWVEFSRVHDHWKAGDVYVLTCISSR